MYVYVAGDAQWQAFMILSLPGPFHYMVFGTAFQELLVVVLAKNIQAA